MNLKSEGFFQLLVRITAVTSYMYSVCVCVYMCMYIYIYEKNHYMCVCIYILDPLACSLVGMPTEEKPMQLGKSEGKCGCSSIRAMP